jgi:hypothetical protein
MRFSPYEPRSTEDRVLAPRHLIATQIEVAVLGSSIAQPQTEICYHLVEVVSHAICSHSPRICSRFTTYSYMTRYTPG